MNFVNFYLAKLFLKINYVNMLNIIKNSEIIPELLQNDCNPNEIFNSVYYFFTLVFVYSKINVSLNI